MVQPINYITGVPDAGDRVMQGYATGLNMQGARQELAMNDAREARAAELQPLAVAGAQLGLDATAQNMDVQRQTADINATAAGQNTTVFNQEQATAQAQAERAAAFQSELADLRALGSDATQDDYRAVMVAYPELARGLSEPIEVMDAAEKKGLQDVLGQAAVALKSGNTELGKDLAGRYAAAARNSGQEDQAAAADAMMKMMDMDPEAGMLALRATITQNFPDMGEAIWGGASAARVQSTQMIAGRVSVQTMSDGTTRVVDTATGDELKGEEAKVALDAANASEAANRGAIKEAETSSTLGAQIDQGGEAAASIEAGKTAQALGLEAFTKVGNIRSNIGTLNKVVDAIDGGANTGQIANRFPAWNASTIELRNLQSQLGLDVVGSVTFGALSEGELNLALNTALPATQNQDDLKKWVVDKIAAQEKLAAYMTEQARFLSRPGNTLSNWLDKVEDGNNDAPEAPPAAAPTTSYLR